jgi:disulfide bond formation protein DsbB
VNIHQPVASTQQDGLDGNAGRLLTAFFVALVATLSAIFIGEVLGRMPCTLCWYQRIAMFPLVWLLGLALWRGDGAIVRLQAGPIALVGLGFALWHVGVFYDLVPASVTPCSRNGPSCSGDAQVQFGVPLPVLSAAAFSIILACLAFLKGRPA